MSPSLAINPMESSIDGALHHVLAVHEAYTILDVCQYAGLRKLGFVEGRPHASCRNASFCKKKEAVWSFTFESREIFEMESRARGPVANLLRPSHSSMSNAFFFLPLSTPTVPTLPTLPSPSLDVDASPSKPCRSSTPTSPIIPQSKDTTPSLSQTLTPTPVNPPVEDSIPLPIRALDTDADADCPDDEETGKALAALPPPSGLQ
ncbi:uncharacterized protein A4U43_C07F38240 [Asparagus officinalis]|uniref:Uncharacterized protein n=1 Tax=Asparagus officinalis TaxID=4686 RepID=A0A5P1EL87_ASPOF|nr:uncharacterized protein A4U43_C07F38240 [Asparagus officinalis]